MHEETRPHSRVVAEGRLTSLLRRWRATLRDLAERNNMVTNILMIALGASIGANLRYGLSNWAAQHWGTTFPYGTMLINVLGSFAIGLVVILSMRLAVSNTWRLLIVTGLLGGFTTFSTFSYETYSLLVTGSWIEAGLNLLGSVGLGMIGVFLGAGLARFIP